MTNKKMWLGMLVLVLVFGMTVVGCEVQTWEEPVIKVENGTTFQVKNVLIEDLGSPKKSDPVGISPGESKTYQITYGEGVTCFAANVRVTLTVTLNVLQEVTIRSDLIRISGGWAPREGGAINSTLLLTGTDSNSLKLNEI